MRSPPGHLMRAEIEASADVFQRAVLQTIAGAPDTATIRAIYTIARGSSDAAATILAYQWMADLHLPVTSLPPSVFSLGGKLTLGGALALAISQSGASEDLVLSLRGAVAAGALGVAITNVAGAPLGQGADLTVPIGAGPELAVPATKSVIGAVGAGLALLAAMKPSGRPRNAVAVAAMLHAPDLAPDVRAALSSALRGARHVYVVGRGSGLGAAQEVALKIKETCAIHAEAHSSAEVLHGPLQLVSHPLTVLVLDTAQPQLQPSLDAAVARFRAEGCDVWHLRAPEGLCAAGASAVLLRRLYPVICDVSLALGLDPDCPPALSKITRTR